MENWERLQNREKEEKPRVWEHQEREEKVRVEKFENGTWDTFRDERLVSNHDTPEEAIERCHELLENISS